MHHQHALKIPKGKIEVKKPNCELFFIFAAGSKIAG